MAIAKSDPILIVGAGAFGLSTALHLNQSGYTNVTVLEKDKQVPSLTSRFDDESEVT